MKYKVGDWVIHNYEIKQIMDIHPNGNVHELSTGTMRVSSMDLTDDIRPLTLQAKVLSESFQFYYKKLNELKGSSALNWPDINRYFSKLCLQAIDEGLSGKKYKEGELNSNLKEALDFYNKVREKIDGYSEINGIALFRR